MRLHRAMPRRSSAGRRRDTMVRQGAAPGAVRIVHVAHAMTGHQATGHAARVGPAAVSAEDPVALAVPGPARAAPAAARASQRANRS